MTISFDLGVQRASRYAPGCLESPFVLRVEIEDDRGKVWPAEQRDWWFPESPGTSQAAPQRRGGVLARLNLWIRSAVFGRPPQRSRAAMA
jgi:hypothetical protein